MLNQKQTSGLGVAPDRESERYLEHGMISEGLPSSLILDVRGVAAVVFLIELRRHFKG